MSRIGNYMIEYLTTHPELDIEDNYNEKQIHRIPTGTSASFRDKADNNADHSNRTALLTNSALT